jgi:hypothetical protein
MGLIKFQHIGIWQHRRKCRDRAGGFPGCLPELLKGQWGSGSDDPAPVALLEPPRFRPGGSEGQTWPLLQQRGFEKGFGHLLKLTDDIEEAVAFIRNPASRPWKKRNPSVVHLGYTHISEAPVTAGVPEGVWICPGSGFLRPIIFPRGSAFMSENCETSRGAIISAGAVLPIAVAVAIGEGGPLRVN